MPIFPTQNYFSHKILIFIIIISKKANIFSKFLNILQSEMYKNEKILVSLILINKTASANSF